MRIRVLMLATALLALPAAPAHAQLGKLKSMVGGGGEKGEVYGLDVTKMGSVVFVVDFSIPVEFTSEQKAQLREYVAQEAGKQAQQKLMEKGGDYAALMAGPAGILVKGAIAKRRDKVGRAREQVKAGIDGLKDDQRFGLITFEVEPQQWHVDLVEADKDHRKDAKEVVGDAQGGDEGGGLLGSGVNLVKSSLMAATGLALQQEVMAAAGGAAAGAVPPEGAPAAQPGAMAVGMPMAPGAPPQVPPSARFAPSADALLKGIEDAIEMEPEAIVLVVGAPPIGIEGEDFLDAIKRKNEKKIPIHVAEFGSDDGTALYRALAEQSGGSYRTASAK